MPTLYTLCGLPFSGKTMLAHRLNARYGFPVVSVDEIKFAHGFPWVEDSPITAADWERIFEESYFRTRELLREGRSVVYDCANLQRESRENLRALAAAEHQPSRTIFVDAPVEVVGERWRENRMTGERFDLPEALFESALTAFVPPAPDEEVLVYDGSLGACPARSSGREAHRNWIHRGEQMEP